jgi:hypothetical protein
MWWFLVTSPLTDNLKHSIESTFTIGLLRIATTLALISFAVTFVSKIYQKHISKKTILIVAAFILLLIAVYLEMIVHAKVMETTTPAIYSPQLL